jgi:tetratricopeptide (TPR) repeat protein
VPDNWETRKGGSVELHSHSLSLGRLLARSARFLIKRFGVFLGIVLVPSAFLAVGAIPLYWSFRHSQQPDPISFYRSLSWIAKMPIVVGMFVMWALVFRANVAAILVTSEDYQGRSIGGVEAYKRIQRKSLRLQWLVVVGSLFLGPLSIIVGPAAAILCLPAMPAAVVERLGVRQALKRTYRLVHVGRAVMVFVSYFATVVILAFGLFKLFPVVTVGLPYWARPILAPLLLALLLLSSQWLFISLTLAYYDGLDRQPRLSPDTSPPAPATPTAWSRFEGGHPVAWAFLAGLGLVFAIGLGFIRGVAELGGKPTTAEEWGRLTGATFGPFIVASVGAGVYYAVRKTRRAPPRVDSAIVGWTLLLSVVSFLGTLGRLGRPPHWPRGATRAAAQRAFEEAEELRKQGTAESLQKAIAKYDEALKLCRDLGERAHEATTLYNIGLVYTDLEEKEKALDYFNQALPLWRALGDREWEAAALDGIGGLYSALGEKQKALDYLNQALPLCRAVGNRHGEAVTLDVIGSVHDALAEKQKALDYYSQAQRLWQALGARAAEATELNHIAKVYSALRDKQKALDYYNQALPLSRAVGDRAGEAVTLNNIGKAYSDFGEKRRALDYYTQALPLRRAAGDRAGEATTLNDIGMVYDALGENQKALDYYSQALPLHRVVGDRDGEARTLNNIGTMYYALGEYQEELDYYSQALPLWRAVGDRAGEAATLDNIGLAYSYLGERQKALAYLNQALPLCRAVEDRGGEAATLNNIALVYDALGEKQKALDYDTQALTLLRAGGDRAREAAALSNIGKVYANLGEYQKALDYYTQALPLRRAAGDRAGEAATLSNIGLVYTHLGERQKALDYLIQALPLLRAGGNRTGEAMTLNNIGGAFHALGEKQEGLDYYSLALPMLRAAGDRAGEAITLNNIGTVYSDLGEKQKALDYFSQALPMLRAVGDRAGEAATLSNIGAAYHDIGENQKALNHYSQALPLRRAVGDRAGEATTLSNKAVVERERGSLPNARASIEAALEIIESLRTKVAAQELRASYFSTVHGYYGLYIDILMRLHGQHPGEAYDRMALEASERSRARSLLETLTEARAGIRQGVGPQLLDRERTVRQRLDAKSALRTKLLGGKHTEEQAQAANKEIDELLSQYQEVEAQIRAVSPHYAALTQPQPLNAKEIQQQVLDSDTLLLEYALGEEHSYLWTVTRNSLTTYTLPKRQEVETLAKGAYDLLREESGPKYWAVALMLSEMILGPASGELQQKRLLIVADGALQYLPFGALPAPRPRSADPGLGSAALQDVPAVTAGASAGPSRPLLLEHEIVYLPSASTLAVLRRESEGRKPAAKLLAVMADPVFSAEDDRVKTRTIASSVGAGAVGPSRASEGGGRISPQRCDRASLRGRRGSRGSVARVESRDCYSHARRPRALPRLSPTTCAW